MLRFGLEGAETVMSSQPALAVALPTVYKTVSMYPLVFSTCTLGSGFTTFEYAIGQVTALVISEKVPSMLKPPRVKASIPTQPEPADCDPLSPENLYSAPNLMGPTVFSYLTP